MTAQDFLDKLDAIVLDLQTDGKGKTVNIMFRNANNQPNILPLSSDANGVVNAVQLGAVSDVVGSLPDFVADYNVSIAPYTAKAAELKTITESPAYQNARAGYKQQNVSENYAELQNAKGAYVI